jgi:DNA repair protein RadD
MKLRQYQHDAIESIYQWFAAGKDAPLVVTPTGSGKSVILAEFIRRACTEFPDTHILVVTHVKELVDQDAKAIKRVWPHAPVGIYSAGLAKRQLKPVTVASIQSVYNKPAFQGRFDLILVDEAHLIPHKSSGMYRKLLEACIVANPDTKLIGLTATPYRLDSGMLHEGEGALFDGISYEANVADLISQGFLCPLTARHGDDVDMSGIKVTGGEFNAGQLGERMSAMELVEHHADLIVQRCADRNAWLIFCVTVEHAAQITAALVRRGVPTEYVSGDMPNHERDGKISAFKAGEIRALVNCSILTTGFDHPATDAVVMLRPTLSPGLYVQMVGRGLRMHESKSNCLVLDFGGNVRRHGFIDKVEPPRKGKKGASKEAPVKACPKCDLLVPIMTRTCECGHVFEVAERESETVHHTGAILSTEVPPVELKVQRVAYAKHVGKSGMPVLRCDYYCGLKRVSEYVCLEHQGFARTKAVQWWITRADGTCPATIDQAMIETDKLAVPASIVVSFATKYPEIKSHNFARVFPSIEESAIV